MERIGNYNNYDKLVLYVKDKKTRQIIKSYTLLGWELVSSVCNHKYRNIMDLTFVRPHKIENKDELQLLQVGMEKNLNSLEKLRKNKYSKSIIFGLTASVVGILSIVLSIIQLFSISRNLDKLLAVILLVIGIACFAGLYFMLPKIYIKETLRFEEDLKKIDYNLNCTYEKIKMLRSENYGKTKN